MATTTKGTLKYRKVQRTPQTGENGGCKPSDSKGDNTQGGGTSGGSTKGDNTQARAVPTMVATQASCKSCPPIRGAFQSQKREPLKLK